MTIPIAGTIIRRVKRERPDITLGWRGADGQLLPSGDFGTFSFSVATSASAPAIFTKTSGISYDLDPDGEYNIRISFSPGEIDALLPNVPYNCQLDSTSSGSDRGFQDFILLLTPAHS
jgi:hypothetical protein